MVNARSATGPEPAFLPNRTTVERGARVLCEKTSQDWSANPAWRGDSGGSVSLRSPSSWRSSPSSWEAFCSATGLSRNRASSPRPRTSLAWLWRLHSMPIGTGLCRGRSQCGTSMARQGAERYGRSAYQRRVCGSPSGWRSASHAHRRWHERRVAQLLVASSARRLRCYRRRRSHRSRNRSITSTGWWVWSGRHWASRRLRPARPTFLVMPRSPLSFSSTMAIRGEDSFAPRSKLPTTNCLPLQTRV